MTHSPHVLWIPSWYPTEDDPLCGNFFIEQAVSLKNAGIRIGIIYPDIRPMTQLKHFPRNHFQIAEQIEYSIPTLRFHGWNLFPKISLLKRKGWVYAAKRLFSRYIAKYGKPDLIHAHSVYWGGCAAYAIAKETSIPYLITEHRSRYILPIRSLDPHIRLAFHNAKKVIAVSSSLKKRMAQTFQLQEDRILCCPNPLDTAFFTPSEKKPESPFRFICIAHLCPAKNYPLLLNAFASLNDRTVRLEIVGKGKEEGPLRQLAEQLQIADRVVFHGALSREEVKRKLQESHALVLSSSYESFGIAAIEAMACGKPVIATRSGGPEETIVEGSGILVENLSQEELVEAMEKMMTSYSNYDQKFIRNYAVNTFGISDFQQNMKKIYDLQTQTSDTLAMAY